MKDLEQRIEEMLSRVDDPKQRAWHENIMRKMEPGLQKRLASQRAFAHPDALLSQAIAYVKQAKQKRNVAIKLVGYGGATGYVKYKGGRDFVLKADANKTYTKWGTGAQIAEDVKYFLEYGVLPPPEGERW